MKQSQQVRFPVMILFILLFTIENKVKIDIFNNFMTSSKGRCSVIYFVKIAMSVIMVLKKLYISK